MILAQLACTHVCLSNSPSELPAVNMCEAGAVPPSLSCPPCRSTWARACLSHDYIHYHPPQQGCRGEHHMFFLSPSISSPPCALALSLLHPAHTAQPQGDKTQHLLVLTYTPSFPQQPHWVLNLWDPTPKSWWWSWGGAGRMDSSQRLCLICKLQTTDIGLALLAVTPTSLATWIDTNCGWPRSVLQNMGMYRMGGEGWCTNRKSWLSFF